MAELTTIEEMCWLSNADGKLQKYFEISYLEDQDKIQKPVLLTSFPCRRHVAAGRPAHLWLGAPACVRASGAVAEDAVERGACVTLQPLRLGRHHHRLSMRGPNHLCATQLP